jgi:transcriptional regulator with GAF, ATPase, and Fis domain
VPAATADVLEFIEFADSATLGAILARACARLEQLRGIEDQEASATVEVAAFLESTPREEIERRQLLTILERNEWNLARAARILGVTRATIYKRMGRFGIQRLRVPKWPASRSNLAPATSPRSGSLRATA